MRITWQSAAGFALGLAALVCMAEASSSPLIVPGRDEVGLPSNSAGKLDGRSPAAVQSADHVQNGREAWDGVEGYPPRIQALLDERERDLASAARRVSVPKGVKTSAVNYVITTAAKWTPGHRLTVAFRGGSDRLRGQIVEAARGWTSLVDEKRRSPNITLDFGDPPNFREWKAEDEEYSADVRIAFDTDDPSEMGYWSAVGDDSTRAELGFGPGQPSMMFYYFDKERPRDWRAIVLHEFGHAFGFQHEHQNPESGCDFRWEDEPGYQRTHLYNNPKFPLDHDEQGRNPSVYSWFAGPYNYWGAETVERNLKKLSNTSAFDSSSLDRKSIMKYYFPAILLVKGENSPCYSSRENLTLSERDKKGFFKAYPPRLMESAKEIDSRVDVLSKVIRGAELSSELKGSLSEKREELMRAK